MNHPAGAFYLEVQPVHTQKDSNAKARALLEGLTVLVVRLKVLVAVPAVVT